MISIKKVIKRDQWIQIIIKIAKQKSKIIIGALLLLFIKDMSEVFYYFYDISSENSNINNPLLIRNKRFPLFLRAYLDISFVMWIYFLAIHIFIIIKIAKEIR